MKGEIANCLCMLMPTTRTMQTTDDHCLVMIGKAVICANSTMQRCVTLSTRAAEYAAMTHRAKSVV